MIFTFWATWGRFAESLNFTWLEKVMCEDRSWVTSSWFSTDDSADNVFNDTNLDCMTQLNAHTKTAESNQNVLTEVVTVTRFSWTWLDFSDFQRLSAHRNVYTDLSHHQVKRWVNWEQVLKKSNWLCIIRIKTSWFSSTMWCFRKDKN